MKRLSARTIIPTGFTLIELLIVISIMTILLGAGLATYQRFNEKQLVIRAGNQFISSVRQVQKKISVGDKPSGCTGVLSGYLISMNASGYTVTAQCSANIVTETQVLSGITVSPATLSIRFSDLGRNVTITNGTRVSFYTSLFSKDIEVTPTGEIIDGEITLTGEEGSFEDP